VAAGATPAAGGWSEGLYYRRTVLSGVEPVMPAYAEEVFGPVAPVVPFGGLGASGTGSRFGGAEANIEAFTETQWLTARPTIAPYPF
jgi:benzaldehyde dehydrogenase (NAD)